MTQSGNLWIHPPMITYDPSVIMILHKTACIVLRKHWFLFKILYAKADPQVKDWGDLKCDTIDCRVSTSSRQECDVVAPCRATPSTPAWLKPNTRRWRRRSQARCLVWRASSRVSSTLSLVWPRKFSRSWLMTTSCSRRVTASCRWVTNLNKLTALCHGWNLTVQDYQLNINIILFRIVRHGHVYATVWLQYFIEFSWFS